MTIVSAHLLAVSVVLIIGTCGVHAGKEKPEPSGLASSSSEADALKIAETVDLKRVDFNDIEELVKRSMWSAARKIIDRSHTEKKDFTAPVRRSAGESKKKATDLLLWLSREYAVPEAIQCATKWAQNRSAILLQARFTQKWDSPGASFAVFSTKGGQGKVDNARTQTAIKDQLNVTLNANGLYAEITAMAGNNRKRYVLNATGLFDVIIPERSHWDIALIRAEGSMQMSRGAHIPELHVEFRKRRPSVKRWPRSKASAKAGHVSNFEDDDWWNDAPGVSAAELETLRKNPPRRESPYTCKPLQLLYCHALDTCVASCNKCSNEPTLDPSGTHCLGTPWQGEVGAAHFTDDDLSAGSIGGLLQWKDPYMAAESFVVWWCDDHRKKLGDKPLIEIPAGGDDDISVSIPKGTLLPAEAKQLLIVAVNPVGEVEAALSDVSDRIQPQPPQGIKFEDTDMRRGVIGGAVQVSRSVVEDHVNRYALAWGRKKGKRKDIESLTSVVGILGSHPRPSSADGSPVVFQLEDKEVPMNATHIIAYTVNGDVFSEPVHMKFRDGFPPIARASSLEVTKDTDSRAGYLTLDVIVGRANEENAIDSYVVYWTDAVNNRIQKLGELSKNGALSLKLSEEEIPELSGIGSRASAFQVVTRNVFGESLGGPTKEFNDFSAEALGPWEGSKIVLDLGNDRGLEVRKLPHFVNMPELNNNVKDGCSGYAMAVDWEAMAVLCVKNDGSVRWESLKAKASKIWHQPRFGSSWKSPQALVADFKSSRALIGSDVDSVIFLLDFFESAKKPQGEGRDGIVSAFRGHGPGGVFCIAVDWAAKRFVSGGEDKTLRLWDLETGDLLKTLTGTISEDVEDLGGHEGKVLAVEFDWAQQRAISASADESLRLWNLTTGSAIKVFEGHGNAVRSIAVDWQKMQFVSGSDDGTMRHWDMQSGETLKVFENHGAHLRAVSARWKQEQAISLSGGSPVLRYWDLKTGQVLQTFGQDQGETWTGQVHNLVISPDPDQ